MGLFLSMSGVINGAEESVVAALRAFAEDRQGSLEKDDLTSDDDGCLVVSDGIGGTSLLYPNDFYDWDGASEFLSKRLGRPVFSFHIHDEDLWMYQLFENGEVVDQFNPIPEYWDGLEPDEIKRWAGNAAAVAQRVPGLDAGQISKYLIRWDDELFASAETLKAYPTDAFSYGEDWQLVDFMRKLGLDYPIDDRGEPHGATYRFRCKRANDA